ncbi:MAG: hypothetical protein HGB06_02010 [Chlorobaculum sp.]|nr:hypothetical protein [Chlorobaculum sp.]
MRYVLLVIWFCIAFFSTDLLAESQNKVNTIIYLSKGKISCYNVLTKTTDKSLLNNETVEKFILSPTKRYLAYEKVIKYYDFYYEIDNKDEKPTKIALSSVVIYDLSDHKKIAEVFPKENELLNIVKWADDNIILYRSGDELSVSGWFTLDTTGVIKDLRDYELSTTQRSIVYSRDRSTMLSIDNSNNLHMIDLQSMKDTQVYSSANNLLDFNMSFDKKYIVMLEVVDNQRLTIDKVTLLSLADSKQTEIYNAKAVAKNDPCISISPDGSVISIELNDSVMILLNTVTKEKSRIKGYGVCWIDNNTFVYKKKSDLYIYNIKNKSEKLFHKNAKKAASFN